jgi:hypothetical protein
VDEIALPNLVHLVFAYAVAFGIQNKVPPLYRFEWLHGFLGCIYCIGFHAGWISWLMVWAVSGKTPAEGWYIIPSILIWALTSAAFCFFFDAMIKWFEVNAAVEYGPAYEEDEDDEDEENDAP